MRDTLSLVDVHQIDPGVTHNDSPCDKNSAKQQSCINASRQVPETEQQATDIEQHATDEDQETTDTDHQATVADQQQQVTEADQQPPQAGKILRFLIKWFTFL